MHRLEEHTGEVRLLLEARSWPELLEEAARGLVSLQAEEPPVASGEARMVEIAAHDREALLVAWIDELIFQTEMAGEVFTETQIERADDKKVRARLRGAAPRVWKTAVKAATFHDLGIEEGEGLVRARIVLDV